MKHRSLHYFTTCQPSYIHTPNSPCSACSHLLHSYLICTAIRISQYTFRRKRPKCKAPGSPQEYLATVSLAPTDTPCTPDALELWLLQSYPLQTRVTCHIHAPRPIERNQSPWGRSSEQDLTNVSSHFVSSKDEACRTANFTRGISHGLHAGRAKWY